MALEPPAEPHQEAAAVRLPPVRVRLEPPSLVRYRSAIASMRRLMWEQAGVLRNGDGLREALAQTRRITEELSDGLLDERVGKTGDPVTVKIRNEFRSLVTTARAILSAALARHESRGAHFREDFPQSDSALLGHHSFYDSSGSVQFLPHPELVRQS